MKNIVYWRVGKHVFYNSTDLNEFFKMHPYYYYAKGYNRFGDYVRTLKIRNK